MTTTPNLGLTKDAETGELYSVSRVNANSDRIDTFAGDVMEQLAELSGISAEIMPALDEDNPTYDTPTACSGICLTVRTSAVGLQIFGGMSGEIFTRSYTGSEWAAWSELVGAAE